MESLDGTPKMTKPPTPTAAPEAPIVLAPKVAEPKAHVESLLTQLSQRDDLKPHWMFIETLKTAAIKGGHNLFSCNVSGTKVALKGMDYPTASPELRADFIRAIHDIKTVTSPHVTSLEGVCLMNFQTRLCAVSEFMDKGSLGSALVDAAFVLSPAQQRDMCLQMALGLQYIHDGRRAPFGHLTSEKVLVNSRFECKLNVFELMKTEYLDSRACTTSFGAFETPYQAPELRRVAPAPYTLATDVYALGVLMAEVFARERPCKAVYAERGLVGGDLHLYAHVDTPAFPLDAVPADIAAIVRQCWARNPAARPTVATIVNALRPTS
ncbi:protein kinase [Achlya hypogyna]|uniref:Protein kinase n=1 Tax=Achlya hypogyna TaxID=1202772 RepID=A0A1V9YNY0_ACHHY|nr:protein kinase [Achlya hypogyna]